MIAETIPQLKPSTPDLDQSSGTTTDADVESVETAPEIGDLDAVVKNIDLKTINKINVR